MLTHHPWSLILAIALVGCTRERTPIASRQAAGQSPLATEPSPSLPSGDTLKRGAASPAAACFASDSLRRAPIVFGDLEQSEEDGDWSGVAFIFAVDSGGLQGRFRDARGGLPPAQPLEDVQYDEGRDSLSFWYATGSGTRYYYSLKPGCDSLVGTARLFVTTKAPDGTLVERAYPRMLHPPPE